MTNSSRISIAPPLILFVLLALIIPLPASAYICPDGTRATVAAKCPKPTPVPTPTTGAEQVCLFGFFFCKDKNPASASSPEKSGLRLQQEEIVRRNCSGSRSPTCVQDGIAALGRPEDYTYKPPSEISDAPTPAPRATSQGDIRKFDNAVQSQVQQSTQAGTINGQSPCGEKDYYCQAKQQDRALYDAKPAAVPTPAGPKPYVLDSNEETQRQINNASGGNDGSDGGMPSQIAWETKCNADFQKSGKYSDYTTCINNNPNNNDGGYYGPGREQAPAPFVEQGRPASPADISRISAENSQDASNPVNGGIYENGKKVGQRTGADANLPPTYKTGWGLFDEYVLQVPKAKTPASGDKPTSGGAGKTEKAAQGGEGNLITSWWNKGKEALGLTDKTSTAKDGEIPITYESKQVKTAEQVNREYMQRQADANKDGSYLAKDGSLLGADGSHLDKDGNYIDKDGNHLDKDGNYLTSDGNRFDKDGNYLGHIDKDGNYLAPDGSYLSKDGTLLDPEGNPVGSNPAADASLGVNPRAEGETGIASGGEDCRYPYVCDSEAANDPYKNANGSTNLAWDDGLKMEGGPGPSAGDGAYTWREGEFGGVANPPTIEDPSSPAYWGKDYVATNPGATPPDAGNPYFAPEVVDDPAIFKQADWSPDSGMWKDDLQIVDAPESVTDGGTPEAELSGSTPDVELVGGGNDYLGEGRDDTFLYTQPTRQFSNAVPASQELAGQSLVASAFGAFFGLSPKK